ncbi:MAG: flagellin [Marinobacter sp.]|nr:flagellin [Marinobacter sp.]
MALGINTNVASLSAQNQLNKSQGMNDQALERLSSGLRINSAKDDAAGLAISTRFQSQISGLNVATRNANDGISLAQTAEGALDEITNNLSRIRELAVQSANATNSASDREALNDEVQQRIAEVDRIASQTAFNGLNVLDGSLASQAFQVGANAGQTIGVDLAQSVRAADFGDLAVAEGAALANADGLSIFVEGEASAGATAFAVTFGDDTEVTNVTLTLDESLFQDNAGTLEAIDDEAVLQEVTRQINDQLAGRAFATLKEGGDGIDLKSSETLTFSDDTAGLGGGFATTTEIAVDNGSVDGVTVDTVANANDAILRMDAALDTVNSFRGELGAVQNRFESTIANLATSSENLSAANSRILDADFASETANLAKSQVLQQAGISVLSQANARPQQVLSLLQ